MNNAIIGLLVVALIVSITFNVSEISLERENTGEDQMSMRRSIAVLPFTSRSNDPENVFFADGIHDDLLTKLAKFGSFKVISRTSVLEYRDTTKNLRQIGQELGVDTILEGSVQKSGNDVRINVQLIDAATDEHLWAQIYDRNLSSQSVFVVQSEISTEISGALQSTLLPSEQEFIAEIPTEDLRAYSLYVSGRDNLYLRRLETITAARMQFEQAIALDPDYAEAHVGLAESILLLTINHSVLERAEGFEMTQASLGTAFDLDPDLSDAYAVEGLLKTNIWSQTRAGSENLEAEAAFERAIGLNPNNAQAYMWFASLRDNEQRIEDAIGLYHRSMQLDPLARIPYSNLPGLYAQQGQNGVALKLWLKAVEIHPEWPTPYQSIADHLFGMGRFDEAYAWSLGAQALSTDPALAGNIGIRIFVQFGDIDRARALLTGLPAEHPTTPLAPGLGLLLDRNYTDALKVFASIIETEDQAPQFFYSIAADVALVAGDFDKTRDFILRQNPLLDSDSALQIDRFTVRDVVKLAFIELQTGNTAHGNEILRTALPVVLSLPRLGMYGQGIRDVQILALLGRNEDALLALRAAVDAGFRGSIPYDIWLLEDDPFLDSIREDPRFVAILSELETLNAVMYQRIAEADLSGNWGQLRALAGAT